MNYKFLILTLFTAVLLFYGYSRAMSAPEEQTMGEIQRIFYYHVPSAWTSFLCFFVNFIASAGFLWKRNRLPLLSTRAATWFLLVGTVLCVFLLNTLRSRGIDLGDMLPLAVPIFACMLIGAW